MVNILKKNTKTSVKLFENVTFLILTHFSLVDFHMRIIQMNTFAVQGMLAHFSFYFLTENLVSK